jgi:hypothetical protein
MQPPIYNPNVPENFSDTLADSQPEFLDNFLKLYNTFMVNHVALDGGATAGNHTIVQLLEQGQAIQTDLNEISVYTKDVAGQTDQIFLRYQGNGQEFQLTNYQIYSINPTTFFTFLPGKILVYFGSFTSLPNNTLNLFPAIAKKIITMSFCAISPLANFQSGKSKIVLQQPSNGFFTALNVTSSFFFQQAAPPSYYIVLANI